MTKVYTYAKIKVAKTDFNVAKMELLKDKIRKFLSEEVNLG
jgi:hypothetical protein